MFSSSHRIWTWGSLVGPKYPLVILVKGYGMPRSLLAIAKLTNSVWTGSPLNLRLKVAIQSRGRTAYYPQLKWKVPVSAWNRCAKASSNSCLMEQGGMWGKPWIPTPSRRRSSTSRGKTKTMPLGCEPYHHPMPKIKEELFISAYNIYIYIYTKPTNGREEKSVLDPPMPVRKDASSNHVANGCPQCCN